MEFKSLGTSKNVTRRFLPVTTVTGPVGAGTLCRVYFLTKDRISVVLPTPAGPMTQTTMGGGITSLVLFTWSTFSLWCSLSRFLCTALAAFTRDFTVNARGLNESPCFSACLVRASFFFLLTLPPALETRWERFTWSPSLDMVVVVAGGGGGWWGGGGAVVDDLSGNWRWWCSGVGVKQWWASQCVEQFQWGPWACW